MQVEPSLVEGPYLLDILDQPAALRRTLKGLEEPSGMREMALALAAGHYKRVVLTGMGSSLFALYPLYLALTNRGLPTLLVETSELIHYMAGLLEPGTLLVAISQSGESAEVVRMVEKNSGRAPLIGVTNNPKSCLAEHADVLLAMQAGTESSVSCKTYIASLLTLGWLGGALTGEDLSRLRDELSLAAPAVDEYLEGWRGHVDEMSAVTEGIRHIFVTARGPSLSTAQTGGLILKESARFAAEGMSCAAFRHGPFEALAPHVLVVICAGDAQTRHLNRGLADGVDGAGGRSALIDTNARREALRIPETTDLLRPIVEILPVQMISLALAARSGREAGRFELASKVTSVE